MRSVKVSSTNNRRNQSTAGQSATFKILVAALCSLACLGVFLSAYLMPYDTSSGPSTSSVLSAASKEASLLSERILQWIPSHHVKHVQEQLIHKNIEKLPSWDTEFWTPIDIDISADPMVTLCKLNFKKYWENPHSVPMFRELEAISNCKGANRRRERMSNLLEDIKINADSSSGRVITPTGFVFHESRVGSTLIANLLASDPYAMVFSESTPIANAILHCSSCSDDEQVTLFRNVLTLMGRSPIHNKMFIKFQSITTTKIEIALKAFPDTPWAFVFRKPVQTMMSHLDPSKGSSSAPCLRSKRNPPSEVRDVIKEYKGARNKNEAWCAAHLNMLCLKALAAYEAYGTYLINQKQRGLLINYDSLPGMVPKGLLPLFGISPTESWLAKMDVESKHYSKSKGNSFKLFLGDSKDKEDRSTEEIQYYAEKILQPAYEKLNSYSLEAVVKIESPSIDASIISKESFQWEDLKDLSNVVLAKRSLSNSALKHSSVKAANVENDLDVAIATDSNGVNTAHSHVLDEKDFIPWAPFSNHHSSRPFERVECPPAPAADYPKSYNMLDIVGNWNTDVTDIPEFHYDSLCHFDHQNESQLQQAYAYREKEVPFVLYNIPELDEVVKKWNNLDYLHKLLGNKNYRTEKSKDNHFMYWRGGKLRGGKTWSPPTDIIQTKFENWLELAVRGQNKSLETREHQYFRVSSDMGSEWLSNELPFFKPKKSIFIVDPHELHGIHCRFGMRSVIAEAHFDGSRNSVVEIGGLRRWIMTHPNQCKNMHMLPPSHPSGRHSEVDWSKPDVEKFPNFKKVQGHEVILQPGDFLFVPTYWIHYIVSLNVNFQCNCRSGIWSGYNKFIRDCGF